MIDKESNHFLKIEKEESFDSSFQSSIDSIDEIDEKEDEISLKMNKIINSISNISKYNGVREWPLLINKELLVIPGENKISIVNVNEYKLVRIIEVPGSSWICGICMLNKNMLLTGDCAKVLRQWKIEGDNLVLISKKEKAHDNDINVLLNLGDGHIASGSDDHTVRIW